jgi:two-component system response regulator
MHLQQKRRKRPKDALHETAERHREIVDNAIDIIYTADLNGRFTSVNRAGERLTGYTEDEARKMDLTQVVAPEYLALVRQMVAHKLAGGGPTTYELEIMTKTGQRVPLEVSSQLIVRNSKPVGIQGIGRNITKRKLAEAENHRRPF